MASALRSSGGGLIPLHGVGIAGTLVVFQGVGQGGGVAAETEVIAGVGRQHD